MELMIVIAIIGLLAAVAVPLYGQYTDKAKFSEVLIMTAERKSAVLICHQETGSFATCNGTRLATDDQGIPADLVSPGQGYASSITTSAGVILATATAELSGLTYQLTPSYTLSSGISWVTSGTCLNARFCSN